MKPIEILSATARAYEAASGRSLARVSTIISNAGHVLPGLVAGQRDCFTDTYTRYMAYFARHWPAGAEWPACAGDRMEWSAMHASNDSGPARGRLAQLRAGK